MRDGVPLDCQLLAPVVDVSPWHSSVAAMEATDSTDSTDPSDPTDSSDPSDRTKLVLNVKCVSRCMALS